MAVKNLHLIIARKFLMFLTWKKILMVLGIAVVLAIIVSVWLVNRNIDTPISISKDNHFLKVSSGIKNEIDTVVKKSPILVGIQVISINFQQNIRDDVYTSFDNGRALRIYEEYLANKAFNVPLFSDNKLTNRRLLRLISGEFVCTPFKETVVYYQAPKLADQITDVCSMAIPPYHGDFSGIFNVYLTSHPTKDDEELLFLLSRDFSFKIYEENKNAKKEDQR
jgi:hypothetical protein